MSIDEQETAEGFGFGNETIDRIPCDCGQFNCHRFANDFDPIIIEGRYFSDYCASDLKYLRLVGCLKEVSERTKKLV